MLSRTFTLEDQITFARLSGDSNPLHVDALQARRTQFGRPVVHGAHLLLWSLERALSDRQSVALAELECAMMHAVGVEEEIDCRLRSQSKDSVRLSVESRGQECCAIRFRLAAPGFAPAFGNRVPSPRECSERAETEMEGASGSLALETSVPQLEAMFPKLASALPHGQLALILATTRLVGMECPGLHSVYMNLSLTFTPQDGRVSAGELSWRVEDYDDRFRRVSIAIAADGANGTVVAAVRPSPQRQPSAEEVSRRLPRPDMFADQRALVIGGSRGLGELSAKILATGGADVRLSYHRGESDARAVVEDIRSAGGRAASIEYDALDASVELGGRLGPDWRPSHVYYFATPPIFVATRGRFSTELFHQFCAYYVDGFYACWKAVRALTYQPFALFYPSSVAVETAYTDMGEYSAAKAAGEDLCRFLEACDRNLAVTIARLPRLPSDQTLSIMAVETDDPVATLLSFMGGGAASQ
jgi:hypothetical protein